MDLRNVFFVDPSILPALSTLGSGLWTVIGGVVGARAAFRWGVGLFEKHQADKQKQRDAIAEKAAAQVNRAYKEHDDSLEDLRRQNERLWNLNTEVMSKLNSLQEAYTSVLMDVKDVKKDMAQIGPAVDVLSTSVTENKASIGLLQTSQNEKTDT